MTQGGGLLQLVAQGKQDVFLTGNPSVTWFKFVYRRYTNFAIESQQMYFDGSPNFGQKITCLVPRNGDLLGPVFLKITLPQLYLANTYVKGSTTQLQPIGYVNSPGHSLIQEISIQIGEQEIDKHTGQWMELWSSLTTDASQIDGFRQMTGQRPGYPLLDYHNSRPDLSGANPSVNPSVYNVQAGNLNVDISGVPVVGSLITPGTGGPYPQAYDEPIMGPQILYIPLRFWFTKNPGVYLPLLAMQYHPIRINLTLAPLQNMFYTKDLYKSEAAGSPNLGCNAGLSVAPAQLGIELWGDYVFLDVPERRRFVSSTLEYLIEQIQYTPPLAIPENSASATLSLQFNHPIKEFIWVLQRNIMTNRHEYFNWSSLGAYEFQMNSYVSPGMFPPNRTDLLVNAKLQLDGQDRFDARDPVFFRLVQPYQRHTRVPSDQYIYVYSIALKPEDLQPSGTLNASRIDNLVLQLGLNTQNGTGGVWASGGGGGGGSSMYNFGPLTAYVYATNYNILRVIDGYAGLLFSV